MLPVIVQREAAMRQSQHAAAMGALTRNQRGATRRTGRGPAERHAEQNRLRGQALQLGVGTSTPYGCVYRPVSCE